MTLDVSSRGVRFLSSRDHRPGQRVFVSFDPAASPLWLDSLWGTAREASAVSRKLRSWTSPSVVFVDLQHFLNSGFPISCDKLLFALPFP